MQIVGRENDDRAKRVGRHRDFVGGTDLQFAAFIVGRLGQPHREGELALLRQAPAPIDMPVIMTAFIAVIDRALERFRKAGDVELVDALVESQRRLLYPHVKPLCFRRPRDLGMLGDADLVVDLAVFCPGD